MKALCFLLTLAGGVFLIGAPVWADTPVLPGSGFTASRYEALWTKSPFAVATPEMAPDSPDYSLVGTAQFDGIDYASLIDKKSQDHILVSSTKPANGLTLISVTRGHDASDTVAIIQKGGQSITLKLEQPPAAQVTANGSPNSSAPPIVSPPLLPMPGSGASGESRPPRPRIRHLPVYVPPPPQQQQ